MEAPTPRSGSSSTVEATDPAKGTSGRADACAPINITSSNVPSSFDESIERNAFGLKENADSNDSKTARGPPGSSESPLVFRKPTAEDSPPAILFRDVTVITGDEWEDEREGQGQEFPLSNAGREGRAGTGEEGGERGSWRFDMNDWNDVLDNTTGTAGPGPKTSESRSRNGSRKRSHNGPLMTLDEFRLRVDQPFVADVLIVGDKIARIKRKPGRRPVDWNDRGRRPQSANKVDQTSQISSSVQPVPLRMEVATRTRYDSPSTSSFLNIQNPPESRPTDHDSTMECPPGTLIMPSTPHLILCPGFIDLHAHSDLYLLTHRDIHAKAKIGQGCTTEIVGQDGISYFPLDTPEQKDLVRRQIAGWNGNPTTEELQDLESKQGVKGVLEWSGVGNYLESLGRNGVSTNVGVLVPQGNLRLLACGSSKTVCKPSDLDRQISLLRQGLDEGALGMSSGLTYTPGMYADTESELAPLCREMAENYPGAFYAPHHRSYGKDAIGAYREMLNLGLKTGCPIHLTHATMNFEENKGKAQEMLDMVDGARIAGLDVTLDTYPYLPGSTTLVALLPSWAAEGGPDAILRNIEDPSIRRRIRHDLVEAGSDGCHGCTVDWSTIEIAGVTEPTLQSYSGKRMTRIAAELSIDPVDVFFEILRKDKLRTSILQHVGDEENVKRVMRHAAHAGGSDGILHGSRTHPRAWATFPRYISHYAIDTGHLPLPRMIAHLTSRSARRLGVYPSRGVIREGSLADVVVFDPTIIRDAASFDEPQRRSEGIKHVIVNGIFAVQDSRLTGLLAGMPIKGGPYAEKRTPGPQNSAGAERQESNSILDDEASMEVIRVPRQTSHHGESETGIATRVSSWYQNVVPVSSGATAGSSDGSRHGQIASPKRQRPTSAHDVVGDETNILNARSSANLTTSGSSPRRMQGLAANLFATAKQKAVGGMRYLLDAEARPEDSHQPIYLLGRLYEYPKDPLTPPASEFPFDSEESPSASDLFSETSSIASMQTTTASSRTLGRTIDRAKRGAVASAGSSAAAHRSGPSSLAKLRENVRRRDSDRSTSSKTSLTSSPSRGSRLDRMRRTGKESAEMWPDGFLDDFQSVLWFSYRSQFAPIPSLSREDILPNPESLSAALLSDGRFPFDPSATDLRSIHKMSPSDRGTWSWVSSSLRGSAGKNLTTDAGWGCMLRTGQSLLANALIRLHLGRDWHLDLSSEPTYRLIVSWFLDDLSPLCPFSVHRMAILGRDFGKEIGEWFGPSTAAGAIKILANAFPVCGLGVVSVVDGTLSESEVIAAAEGRQLTRWQDIAEVLPLKPPEATDRAWGPLGVLVLAGVRLGVDGVNPVYHDCIQSLFKFPQCVGIAGGRPSSSYFFVGVQGDSLLYLDPHFTRPSISVSSIDLVFLRDKMPLDRRPSPVPTTKWQQDAEQFSTFHTDKVRRMPLSSMDPSMLVGFLCKDEADWRDLRRRIEQMKYKIFEISDRLPTYFGHEDDDLGMQSLSEDGDLFEEDSA